MHATISRDNYLENSRNNYLENKKLLKKQFITLANPNPSLPLG
jgi:hypothetical protein